ncbi:hypothetical protein EF888_21500 [Silicimonas algicola]|uniref:Uncharacterized protein n=1 Tax=Silicimonas algicola TaxID=1826607 RepID=A0A316G6J8_9RHOB|nr:hypothetical protein [Silicimonas algicola]AZQ69497.1 hypothetical protein EF888_21500 [Silicimonas algicola]PWK56571.1 hypothetical protein C8D95_104244 [Silicimonas algicola]
MNEQKSSPANAQRIWRVADLPKERSPATYVVCNEGQEPSRVTLQKRLRQVLDLLRAGPVYCASPVRLSDIVHILKRDQAIKVETTMYPGDPDTGASSYGVYSLLSTVDPEPLEVAA